MKKGASLIVAVVVVTVGVVVTVSKSKPSTHNSADVMFAQMMIPHHEQAIELADLALQPGRGASATITTLSEAIRATQGTEATLMNKILLSWGETTDTHGHGSMMDGIVSASSMAKLQRLDGPDFDTAWAKAMVAHHQGAVAMARDVLERGSNSEIRTLARHVIKVQQKEISILLQRYPN